jgi:hypothetical protein
MLLKKKKKLILNFNKKGEFIFKQFRRKDTHEEIGNKKSLRNKTKKNHEEEEVEILQKEENNVQVFLCSFKRRGKKTERA